MAVRKRDDRGILLWSGNDAWAYNPCCSHPRGHEHCCWFEGLAIEPKEEKTGIPIRGLRIFQRSGNSASRCCLSTPSSLEDFCSQATIQGLSSLRPTLYLCAQPTLNCIANRLTECAILVISMRCRCQWTSLRLIQVSVLAEEATGSLRNQTADNFSDNGSLTEHPPKRQNQAIATVV